MLEKCCSFMTQTNVSLPGDSELVQSTVQFPIALTSTEAVHTLRYTDLTYVSLELKFDVVGSTLQLCFFSLSQVDGIQGIMTSYTSALFNVSLAGPTLFGPVINSAAMIASASLAQGSRKYYVLLIITVSICI